MLQGKNATINSRANWNWHHQQRIIIFSFRLTQSTDLWHVFDWERWPLFALLLFLSDSGKNNSRPLTWEKATISIAQFYQHCEFVVGGPAYVCLYTACVCAASFFCRSCWIDVDVIHRLYGMLDAIRMPQSLLWICSTIRFCSNVRSVLNCERKRRLSMTG